MRPQKHKKGVEIAPATTVERKKRVDMGKGKKAKNKVVFSSSIDPYDQPLQWWETQPIKYAFSNPPVRSRLEMLMGSNVVRLTDRKYMLRLMARIRQDYESRQQSRIEERMKNELMRTKMMILNRYIPVQDAPVEIRRYPLFQLYLYCDSIIEARQKKRSSRQVKIAESLYRMLYPELKPAKGETDDEEEEIYMKRIVVNGVEQLIPLSDQETAEAKKEHETSKDIENGYVLTQDEYDRLHYETEAIKELREAQTVGDMYAKAHDILGILYSYADDGRYKKQEIPDKKDDAGEDSSAGTKDNDEMTKTDEQAKA